MKLFVRPDKFTDSKGNEVQLQDIEIDDISFEACFCGCDGITGEVTILAHDQSPLQIVDKITEVEDIQDIIEKMYNASIGANRMLFKTI